ncbi:hypothetical protein GQX73_g4700 [Xylaria multiplex]|uniref:Uncharacterized protein n=1 Tax=Xylaria multiplex TaxID=323545 RepID=A0A7C8MMM0_9PEZI|nr:hypothetical protein GQX73_g4700 [Xylaria multiplex]
MRSLLKAICLIITTIPCVAPATAAVSVHPVFAASEQVVINEPPYDPPGLGIELEVTTLTYRSPGKNWQDLTATERESLKGKPLIPENFPPVPPTKKWKLTGEISPANLMTEMIVDGRQHRVGDDDTYTIGREIIDYVDKWYAFCKSTKCQATIEGNPAGANPWEVTFWKRYVDAIFQAQVTTAMPMEGVLQVLQDSKAQNQDNALINVGQDYNSKIVIVKPGSFESFPRIRHEDINAEFLGFFSLLASYCVAASEGDPNHGPKRGLNIMPRTNFLTMYKTFAKKKLKEQLAAGVSLYDIVRVVAALDDRKWDIRNRKFKWKPQDLGKPVDEHWPGKEDDIRSGELSVEKFLNTLEPLPTASTPPLDLLMLMDKMVRHGQIGGLGDRMEGVYGNNRKPAPILEFRDLPNVCKDGVALRMKAYNQQVVDLHGKATTLDREEAGELSEL